MKRQIITLAVDFDITHVPPPENWDWADVAFGLGGAAVIEVLATGALQEAPPK